MIMMIIKCAKIHRYVNFSGFLDVKFLEFF